MWCCDWSMPLSLLYIAFDWAETYSRSDGHIVESECRPRDVHQASWLTSISWHQFVLDRPNVTIPSDNIGYGVTMSKYPKPPHNNIELPAMLVNSYTEWIWSSYCYSPLVQSHSVWSTVRQTKAYSHYVSEILVESDRNARVWPEFQTYTGIPYSDWHAWFQLECLLDTEWWYPSVSAESDYTSRQ